MIEFVPLNPGIDANQLITYLSSPSREKS